MIHYYRPTLVSKLLLRITLIGLSAPSFHSMVGPLHFKSSVLVHRRRRPRNVQVLDTLEVELDQHFAFHAVADTQVLVEDTSGSVLQQGLPDFLLRYDYNKQAW